jgi:hypothetical protein
VIDLSYLVYGASAARFGPAYRAVIHVTLTSTVSEPHTVQKVPKAKADAKHGGSRGRMKDGEAGWLVGWCIPSASVKLEHPWRTVDKDMHPERP